MSREALADLHLAVPGGVATGDSVLDLHARDESPYPPVRPWAVVTARTTGDVVAALQVCHRHRIPVVPFGAGSSLEAHVLPVHGGVSLDLSTMTRVISLRPHDLTVEVEAGVHRVALNEQLGAHGLFFPVDPGADATLGGMAATSASGTTTVRYGGMRENVLAVRAVTIDGRVVRSARATRKNSAGYDLTRLLIGSEGTLAVITELTLKIHGIPERMAAAVCAFPTLVDAVAAATAVVRSGIAIARCELLDPMAVRMANAHSGLALTEEHTLFFEFHGSETGVAGDIEQTREVVIEFGGREFQWAATETERRRLWRARHELYFAGLAWRPGHRILSTDSAVPLSALPAAVESARSIMSDTGLEFSILGHVADGNFHCLVLVDPASSDELGRARRAAADLNHRVQDLGGTCTGEHGIGQGKISALEDEAGPEAIDMMLAIKNAFDPLHLLNPGKVLRATVPVGPDVARES